MAPGMRYVAALLQERINKTALLKSSNDLVQQVSGGRFTAGSKVVQCDIKSYFWSGDHNRLIDESKEEVAPELRQPYLKLLQFLLNHQIVTMPGTDNRAWRVKRCSSMGIICSGEVSEVAFKIMVEDGMVNNERNHEEGTSMRRRYGLEAH